MWFLLDSLFQPFFLKMSAGQSKSSFGEYIGSQSCLNVNVRSMYRVLEKILKINFQLEGCYRRDIFDLRKR
jgi:hypothetical protein